MKRLKELRERYGLSLRKLDEYIGVDYSSLAKLERDETRCPAIPTLKKIAQYFAVSTEYLLEESNDGFYVYVSALEKMIEVSQNKLDSLIEEKSCEESVRSDGVYRVIFKSSFAFLSELGVMCKEAKTPNKVPPQDEHIEKYKQLNQPNKNMVNSMIDALWENENK